jgi:hypothetical protein
MGQIRLGVGQVNITNYLIAVARKTTTPLVIEAQESYAPPHPATRNVVVPAAGDIDPVIYYVDFYESSNGVSLDLLLSQFVYDLKNNIIISERRFYVVGGPGSTDPAADQNILSDSYLDGKTISGVFKEGFRYLRPSTETIPEWQPHTGGGIELLNNMIFSGGEVWSIEISYLVNQTTGAGNSGMYNGVVLISSDTTLTTTHRNKRLRCESAASNKLVVTLESVGVVPDGTFYHFTSNMGNQNQTRILPASSETILYNGENYTEISFGKGEFVRIVKTGIFWEAEMAHPNILQVGERFSGTWNLHPSTKPEDGFLYDGDEWPRMWWWVVNKLPSTHKIVDDTVISGGYVHPADKLGLFVVHSTEKKFRLPNTQNISERGLKAFGTYNIDAERVYDYPGGVQNEMIGPHVHSLPADNSGSADIQSLTTSANADEAISTDHLTGYNIGGTENRVKNIGVIYLRRF